jgi:hypothetical protein
MAILRYTFTAVLEELIESQKNISHNSQLLARI